MRNFQFIIFFSIVILIFGLLSYYIYSRGIRAFPVDSGQRIWFQSIFVFLSASYIIARFLERLWISPVSDVFTWIGSFWLGAFFYFLLLVLAIDILRLIDLAIPVIPQFMKSPEGIRWVFFSALGLVSVLLIAGHINARYPRLKTLDLKVNKKVDGVKQLSIAFASDIHLGTLVGPRRTRQLVNSINALNADIILLGGDIVDEDLAPVIHNNLGNDLARLSAPLGVYGITGNHEYIGGAEEAVHYLEEHGIHMIRDSFALIENKIYILGREDHDSPRFGGHRRKSVAEMMQGVDREKPLILLDHQPYDLDEKSRLGVDLTLSGHTHHGQMWPLNYITQAIFEVSWGYEQKGSTHVYVSSGAGGWGPPIRIGNRPEIVKLNLNFQE